MPLYYIDAETVDFFEQNFNTQQKKPFPFNCLMSIHVNTDGLIDYITGESSLINYSISVVRPQAMMYRYFASDVYLPECLLIGDNAFRSAFIGGKLDLPKCSLISYSAFRDCRGLKSVFLPACKTIYLGAFLNCRDLSIVSLPVCSYIGSSAFCSCTALSSLYLMGSSVVRLDSTNVFHSTRFGSSNYHTSGTGSIYVPSSLYSSYLNEAKWAYFSQYLVGI